jgi:hypothetical protein
MIPLLCALRFLCGSMGTRWDMLAARTCVWSSASMCDQPKEGNGNEIASVSDVAEVR